RRLTPMNSRKVRAPCGKPKRSARWAMDVDLLAALRRSAETGELVAVIYHGGSQPGTVREIGVVRIGTGEVWARDGQLPRAKKFLLAKLRLVEPSRAAERPAYDLA